MYNSIICRYHEIATKGNNRNMFERCLCDNIRHLLREIPDCRVSRVRGRIRVEHSGRRPFTPEELEIARRAFGRAFGLESVSPALLVESDEAAILAAALELGKEAFAGIASRTTFRIRAHRGNKRFPLTSRDLEIKLVTAISEAVGPERFTIDLDHAAVTLGVDVRDEFTALFLERIPAPGGLPVGSNPRVLTLLSGGIDSPVAAWLIMKRGSATDYITFHSSPYTPPETVDKVSGIAKALNEFQRNGRLFAANLAPLQKLIRDHCNEKFRTVLYRRAMFRIAERIARREGCRALVTGESLGQVASQTIDNLDTINAAIDMLVLRPLIGADKLETIAAAESIGTMALSSVQVPDSCTVFAPSSPATAAKREHAEAEEAKIPGYREVLEEIIANVETRA